MWNQHKLVLGTTVGVFLLSFLISYCQIDLALPQFLTRSRKSDDDTTTTLAANEKSTHSSSSHKHQSKEQSTAKPVKSHSHGKGKSSEDELNSPPIQKPADVPLKIFTAKELAQYDGSAKSKGLYLAILGRVYDVSKGQKHYGPGGGYHFFAGKHINAY